MLPVTLWSHQPPADESLFFFLLFHSFEIGTGAGAGAHTHTHTQKTNFHSLGIKLVFGIIREKSLLGRSFYLAVRMGHYATQVEQGSTESCTVEILIMMLPVLPYLSQLRLTTHADSAEYQTS